MFLVDLNAAVSVFLFFKVRRDFVTHSALHLKAAKVLLTVDVAMRFSRA